MTTAIRLLSASLLCAFVGNDAVRPLPTVEKVREAFEHLCEETRCGPFASFAWSSDETKLYFLDQRDVATVALRRCDIDEETWSTVFKSFRSKLGRLAVSSDDWWVVAWDERDITIGSLVNGMTSRLHGRFMWGGCLTPDSEHLIIWGRPSKRKEAGVALLSVPLAFGAAGYNVLFAPPRPISDPQVEISSSGNRLLWGYRVVAGQSDTEPIMRLSDLIDGALRNTIELQMPSWSSDWTMQFLGDGRLIGVASDVNERFTFNILTLDIAAALADGEVGGDEWTIVGPKLRWTRASLSIDPLGDFVVYNRYGFQRRQRAATGVFRLADPGPRASIDAGWDMANVSWSPRGSFCVSVVGTQHRAEPSIKVLTRGAVERLLNGSQHGGPER